MNTWHERLRAARLARGYTTLTEFAKKVGVRVPTAHNWESGATKTLKGVNLHRVCTLLKINPEWLLSGRGERDAQVAAEKSATPCAASCAVAAAQIAAHGLTPITEWGDPEDLPDDQFVIIPRRKVSLLTGKGSLVFQAESAPGLAFTSAWVRKKGIRAENAVIVYAQGDSMQPRIRDGDILLVDLLKTEIREGEVYAIRYDADVRVKRLFRRYDGALILRSDNRDDYPDEIIPADVAGMVSVIGEVIWRGGDV